VEEFISPRIPVESWSDRELCQYFMAYYLDELADKSKIGEVTKHIIERELNLSNGCNHVETF
jgi:hypothetical protein